MSALPPGFVLDSAPQAGPVYGPPPKAAPPPTPFQIEDQQMQRENARRAAEDQAMQRDKFEWEKKQRDKELAAGVGIDGKARESEAKAAAFLIRALGSNESYEGAGVGPRSLPGQVLYDNAPNLLNILPSGIGNSPDRQVADSAQDEFIAASLRQDSGAAIPEEEMERQRRIYFPMPGDSEQVILAKRQARLRAIEGLRQSSGVLEQSAEQRYQAMLGPLVNQEGQIAGNNHDNGDSGEMQIARGETRREDDPMLAGVRDEYIRRLGSGATAGQLIAWARAAGINDPAAYRSIAEQVKFRDENPGIALSEYDTSQLDDRVVPITDREREAANSADSPLGAFFINAGDAATGFNLDSLVGMTGGNAERTRLGMGEIAERNPGASLAGTVTGGTLAALAGEGAIASRLGLTGMRAGLAGDAAYGAVAGAGQADYASDGSAATMSDRMTGAGLGTLAGLTGSFAGQKIAGGAQRFARGVRDPSVATLQDLAIPLTVGQQLGQSGRMGAMAKGIEDRVSGLPVVGEAVQARRMEGYRKFNSVAFDKALEPIGGQIGDKVGEEAVAAAQEQVSAAYGRALAGKAVVPDQAFNNDLSNSLTRAGKLPRVGDEIMDQIVEILRPYDAEPNLTGEAMQTISQELGQLKRAYRNDPLKKRIGDVVDAAENSIFGLFERQAPEVMPDYNAAKAAYRRLSVLQDAVEKGKNTGGVFSPSQLGTADWKNAKKYDGQNAAARGDRSFADLQRAAQEVLPSNVPDSGTAGRVAVPAVAAGQAPLSALTIGAVLTAAYTKAGQRLLTKPGRGMKGRTGKMLQSEGGQRAIRGATAAGAVAALPNQ